MNTAININIFRSGNKIKSFSQKFDNFNFKSVMENVTLVRVTLNSYLTELVDAEKEAGAVVQPLDASDDDNDDDEPPDASNVNMDDPSGSSVGVKRQSVQNQGIKHRKK